MLLCLDAGNSRLKWGLFDGQTWLRRGALEHARINELAADLPARPARILACNVAGAAVAARIEALALELAAPLTWFESVAQQGGVMNGYDNPMQLGADRWAALVGARSLHAGAALVVMAGTATTVDLLDTEGIFRGGLILPGVELMRQALAQNTAGLPKARGTFRLLPTNTDDAIESGILMATLGAIERMRATACRPTGADPGELTVLLSGGAAEALLPHLAPPVRHVAHLVLEGLARVATAGSSS